MLDDLREDMGELSETKEGRLAKVSVKSNQQKVLKNICCASRTEHGLLEFTIAVRSSGQSGVQSHSGT